ncbi:MAG: hypothetical protein KF850_32660 [Labilithrix sp.]|nr:hypothetical protein [Labilithrix sp.]
MRLLKHVTTFTLVFSAIAIGCAVSAEDQGDEPLGALAQALPRADAAPYDPTDHCRADCAGKACGARDGCFGVCETGSCPAGTVCGGAGERGVCACPADCAGKPCGAPDGCGGICTAGTCASGAACGGGGTPGVCAPLQQGQGVECFVFNDGYTAMAGPSEAIYFNYKGEACIPDATPGGLCRRWFGRCRTTDPSHTPVEFAVGDTSGWHAWADAVFSHHEPVPGTKYETATMCIPGGPHGFCSRYFGGARTITGNRVRCRVFEDGYTNPTHFRDRMMDSAREKVMARQPTGTSYDYRKWFGRCEVSGCGDAVCDPDAKESHASCPKDCRCGDGVCEGNETVHNCSKDCWCGNGKCDPGEKASECATDCWCGDGKCDPSESRQSCPKDCGGTWCGDGVCSGGETCGSCAADCGECVIYTCSGKKATAEARDHTVYYEDLLGCAGAASMIASSRNEAEECVAAYGVKVVTSGTPRERVFHTDPTWGCSSLTVPSFSDESAARCAATHGYTRTGPCPAPVAPSDAGAGKGDAGK